MYYKKSQELHTGQAAFVHGGSKKNPIYLVILKLATMQYILQYNHWQQISSTTNILKHNTEMYHCGEKTELVGLNTTGHYRTKYRKTTAGHYRTKYAP